MGIVSPQLWSPLGEESEFGPATLWANFVLVRRRGVLVEGIPWP